MQFYTYDYIMARSQFGENIWYALSFLALAALLFVSVKYLRNRLVTRYRDLIVILFLAVAFLGGMQWNDYNRSKSDAYATSRMVQFLRSLSTDVDVPVREIRVNATNLRQGMLVDVRGTFYVVTFNADFTAFQYERTHLLNREIQIVDRGD
ncbi:DUF3290 domain-containing protein [uncultured Selenomonas sp.]|uniref:DUF3290 domain-containing protein n=1 Tax=uncultured Selenomonas sp. TaxID=159275 RepID=UPI0028D631EC|nr:DUF3290 domain-containing protein [uncultured Selenomonas sp.]